MTLRALANNVVSQQLAKTTTTTTTANGDTRDLQSKGQIELVDLTDFDVQIGVTENQGIQIFEVTDIVTRFMQSTFGRCIRDKGWSAEGYAQFDTIILLQRSDRRRLQDGGEGDTANDTEEDTPTARIGDLYVAEFKGAALFTRKDGETLVPDTAVYDCQRITFLQDDLLLQSFQNSGAAGLGTAVVNVQAYVNPGPQRRNPTDSQDSSLEMVIIIAIVIACVAFLFLIFAIFWAWRYDKRNRQAFLAEHRKSPDETFDAENSPEAQKERPSKKSAASAATPHDDTPLVPAYPSVVGGDSQADGMYPESVISEDIHSSLSQYYAGGTTGNYNYTNGRLQDAASVSSMESYGYSLDGYTPSLTAQNPMVISKTTSLPTEPANTDAWKDTRDMRRGDDAGNDWGISTDYAVKRTILPMDAETDDEHPMYEQEMPPPPDAEDYSILDSTLADESAIHTYIAPGDR